MTRGRPRNDQSVRAKIIIIAGPNGAGKTTFAEEFLPTVDAWALYDNSGNEPVLIEEVLKS